MTNPAVSKGIRLMTTNNLAVSDYAMNVLPSAETETLARMHQATADLASYILWLERRVAEAYKEFIS